MFASSSTQKAHCTLAPMYLTFCPSLRALPSNAPLLRSESAHKVRRQLVRIVLKFLLPRFPADGAAFLSPGSRALDLCKLRGACRDCDNLWASARPIFSGGRIHLMDHRATATAAAAGSAPAGNDAGPQTGKRWVSSLIDRTLSLSLSRSLSPCVDYAHITRRFGTDRHEFLAVLFMRPGVV